MKPEMEIKTKLDVLLTDLDDVRRYQRQCPDSNVKARCDDLDIKIMTLKWVLNDYAGALGG